jgi:hypothetical protein
LVHALAVVVVLAAVAAPVAAQTDTPLCLRVQAAPDVDLTDASVVQAGEILVTDVVPCDAVIPPVESGTPVSDVGTGAWVVGPVEVDPMTDERRARASLVAESGAVWYGDPYTLTIACADGSTQLTATWHWQLGPERLINVNTRIGDGEVTTEPWFNEGQATGYGHVDSDFVESLFGETRLALQIEVPDEGPAIADFDITGIENAVANVREACGW